ncbi:ABC transporter substrate-binding protein [Natronolimnobius baerhuensis]|uniref:ABC transporter substrate-binding protein n=1 Tax=Natronolimnobius baerhuensis TaxID=253108 RepID=A0A202EDR0_9EURY|nr:ABC transporter substrate-binding protein [Natronolimnobius baerhuensis]OVE86355.1 ABC transporter substrate-binding protein [Natronolimnobius baerhuensis]
MVEDALPVSRRTLLAGVAGGTASSLAGCSEQFWSRAENTAPDQVELTIKTLPADDDAFAAQILSQFRENLEEAGIDVSHEPIGEPELYRDVLLEGEYDIFVARHPGVTDYDDLYELLHSRFGGERGWQNPFHYSDVTVDDTLEEQRFAVDTENRREAVGELISYLDEVVPYTTVAFPNRIAGVREPLDVSAPPHRGLDYLRVLSHELEDGPRDGPLVVGVFGEQIGERLNPLVVDRNRIDGFLELLYAPLLRRTDYERSLNGDTTDGYTPWLAADIEWSDIGPLEATVTLHDGLTWHDGTPLEATDVAFTFGFLQDTSDGDIEGGLPAPRFRGRSSLVEHTEVLDSETIRIRFDAGTQSVAIRALSVPIFPAHIWEPRTAVIADYQTQALVTDNDEPVGSGLFRVSDVSTTEIELEPFDEHVFRVDPETRPDELEELSQFEGIRFQVDPNPGAMIEALLEGDIDITGDPVPPSELEAIREEPAAQTVTGETTAFYMVGYNMHHPELGNPHFRRIISQLIDREHVVEEFFDGEALPATGQSSMLGIRNDGWGFEHRSTISTFPGSDGDIDSTRVQLLFEDAGYRYEDGELLR